MKKAKIKRKSYDYGGNIDLSHTYTDHDYIDNPDTLIAKNNINWAKAKSEVATNPLIQGGKMLGGAMKQVGVKMIGTQLPGSEQFLNMGLEGIDMYNHSQGLDNINPASQKMGRMIGEQIGDKFISPESMQKMGDGIEKFLRPKKFAASHSQFAFGGEVPVEVEGDEAYQLPNGQVGMFQGPTHEEGGIDVDLPEGTDIYSDRIAIDGKTMAQRKLIRENKIKRLENKLRKNPNDIILKNTLSRVSKLADIENEKDMQVQKSIGAVHSNLSKNGNRKKAWTGLRVGESGPEIPDDILNLQNTMVSPVFDGNQEKGMFTNGTFVKPNPLSFVPQKWDSTQKKYVNNLEPDISEIDGIQLEPDTKNFASTVVNPNAHKISTKPGIGYKLKESLKSVSSQPDMGGVNFNDIMGMSGNYLQAMLPYYETLNNRATDQPNINPYKDFGKDTINELEGQKGYVKQLRNQALSDLELSRTGAIKRNRNSARSINTQRALDLTTDQVVNRQQADIYDKSVSQMLGISNQVAQAKTQKDQMYMQGEMMRDENNRKDKDNHSKQLSRNLRDIGEMITTQGDTLNRIKSRKANLKLTSEENSNFYSDAKGVVYSKKTGLPLTAAEIKQYAKEKASKDSDPNIPSYEDWKNYTEDQKDYWRTVHGKSKK